MKITIAARRGHLRRGLEAAQSQESTDKAARTSSLRSVSRLRSVGTLIAFALAVPMIFAQTPPPPAPVTPPAAKDAKPETHITEQQAKELFSSVDTILKFSSSDSKLPILRSVKRRLTTRDAVEQFLTEKFNEDESAKRLQRSEIVLKKFGLLDRDFSLRPFLMSLLKEQIAGYYDNKTKTVNLLDWIEPDAQKPTLAHELTHALQDQHTDLEKWGEQTKTNISRDHKEDNEHIATDEVDTARDAVLEGQAMVVFVDFSLKASGRKISDAPQLLPTIEASMGDTTGSPIMARAPLVLKDSLMFPYREGLGFVGQVQASSGTEAAFAGAMDRPPASSFEILNPEAYVGHVKVPVLNLPDVHPLLDATYDPYDVGVMGEVDVRMLTELFAGPEVAHRLAPAWRGGIYYATQRKSATTPEQKASTASLGLMYLSRWATPEDAKQFASVYAAQMPRKYAHASPAKDDPTSDDDAAEAGTTEQVFDTNEGPAVILTSGSQVLTLEGFDLPLARKLELLMVGAQPGADTRIAANTSQDSALPAGAQMQELTGNLRSFMAHAGLMKVALSTVKIAH